MTEFFIDLFWGVMQRIFTPKRREVNVTEIKNEINHSLEQHNIRLQNQIGQLEERTNYLIKKLEEVSNTNFYVSGNLLIYQSNGNIPVNQYLDNVHNIFLNTVNNDAMFFSPNDPLPLNSNNSAGNSVIKFSSEEKFRALLNCIFLVDDTKWHIIRQCFIRKIVNYIEFKAISTHNRESHLVIYFDWQSNALEIRFNKIVESKENLREIVSKFNDYARKHCKQEVKLKIGIFKNLNIEKISSELNIPKSLIA